MGEVRLNLDEWIHFTSTITQSGNSLVITIPKHVREAYKLREGMYVEVYARPRLEGTYMPSTGEVSSLTDTRKKMYDTFVYKILDMVLDKYNKLLDIGIDKIQHEIVEILSNSSTSMEQPKSRQLTVFVNKLIDILNSPECVDVVVIDISDSSKHLDACFKTLKLQGIDASSFLLFYNVVGEFVLELKFISYLKGTNLLIKRTLTIRGAEKLGHYPPVAYTIAHIMKTLATETRELSIPQKDLAEALTTVLEYEPSKIVGKQLFVLGFEKAVRKPNEDTRLVLCEAETEYDPEHMKNIVQKVTCTELC